MKWTTHLMENLTEGETIKVDTLNGQRDFEIRYLDTMEHGVDVWTDGLGNECVAMEGFLGGSEVLDQLTVRTSDTFYGVPSILELDCELFSLIVTGGYDAPMDAEAAAKSLRAKGCTVYNRHYNGKWHLFLKV